MTGCRAQLLWPSNIVNGNSRPSKRFEKKSTLREHTLYGIQLATKTTDNAMTKRASRFRLSLAADFRRDEVWWMVRTTSAYDTLMTSVGTTYLTINTTMLSRNTICNYLTRFITIAIPNYKFQMASGQGSHWLIECQNNWSSMYSPSHIRDLSILLLNIFTLLALTQSFDSLFHLSPSVRISTFSCSTYAVPYLMLLCVLWFYFFKFEEHIPINILITIQYFKHFYLVSS